MITALDSCLGYVHVYLQISSISITLTVNAILTLYMYENIYCKYPRIGKKIAQNLLNKMRGSVYTCM